MIATRMRLMSPTCSPLAPLDTMNLPSSDQENGWWGTAYVYDEAVHPTAWTGQLAVDWIHNRYDRSSALLFSSRTLTDRHAHTDRSTASVDPFLLKVSFLRPHSPYDPPTRLWEKFQGFLNEGVCMYHYTTIVV